MDRRIPRLVVAALAIVMTIAGAVSARAQSAPLPPPPFLAPPAGFAAAETAHVRWLVQTNASMDAAAVANAYGPMMERIFDDLAQMLPAPAGKIEIVVYGDDSQFLAATANPPRPDLSPSEVVADPGGGDIAISLPRLLGRSALDGENLLRHAMTHVVTRKVSAGGIPRGFDEGFAAYAEYPVSARLARSAALVQTAMQAGDLLTWSDLNRPQPTAGDPAVAAATDYSMTAFLIDRQGVNAYGEFIAAMGDQPDWRAAMREVYKRSPTELEAAWKENLPQWVAGGWRDNLFAAFDLQPARDLLAKAHYAEAKDRLEQSLRLFTDLGDAGRQDEVGRLLRQADVGLQAESLMTQIQQALEGHTYDRAHTLLAQAHAQYGLLPTDQRPTDLMTAYDAMADRGLAATADLETAQRLSQNWRDYAEARAAALRAGTSFAELGDGDMLDRVQSVMADLDTRQRRLVVLLAALALLTLSWLALWLWARGPVDLDWGPIGGRLRPRDGEPSAPAAER
ncbi:MAG TPA: hypothetical protein VFI22_16110 [Thermomicrobiales bacterium]|nr:hypothetical protein [Thermomicrobiales bacterium]